MSTKPITKSIRIGTAEQHLLSQLAGLLKVSEADTWRVLIYEGAAARGLGTASYENRTHG
jgi:hypothetical protein